MPRPLLNAFIDEMPKIQAAESLNAVMVAMAANPDFDKDFREGLYAHWQAVKEGLPPPKSGPEELVGAQGLIGWLARYGHARSAVIQADRPIEAEAAEATE